MSNEEKQKWEGLEEPAEKPTEDEKALGFPSREELEQQLTKAEQNYQETLSALHYAQAALENERKLAHKEIQNERQYGQKNIIKELLNIADSLEKSLEVIEQQPGDNKTIHEGVELTFKMLLNLLEKHSTVMINPVGVAFDPNWHQAMSMVENPEVKSGHVITVLQKGYKMHDRLIRPALVIVAKRT